MRHEDRSVRTIEEIGRILDRADTIRIGINGSDGYPYVVPVSFGWELENNVISVYFHGAKKGDKFEALQRDPRVCVEADILNRYAENGHGGFTADYESVIGFGVAESLSGCEAVHGLRLLLRHCGISEAFAEPCEARGITEVTRIRLTRVTGKKRFNTEHE